MKKLFAAMLIAMLVVLPMTALAANHPTYPSNSQAPEMPGAPANLPTYEDPEAFVEDKDPAVVKPLIAVDYLTPEEPRPIEAAEDTVVPATGVFAAVAASAALLAMGLAVAKKN